MKKPIVHSFQYLSLVRYKGLKSVLKNYENYEISIILDLEDSAQDLFDQKKTSQLKKIARDGLIFLSKQKLKIKNSLFLRINKIDTMEFEKDLIAIKKAIVNGMKINGIFLPKVENFFEIESVYKKINSENLKIVPIIESVDGVKNLISIIEKDKNKIISFIHYGHFDYCLNSNLWPFPEPYHLEFWNIIDKIIKTCVTKEINFIQTPFPLIQNHDLYWSMVKHLADKYNLDNIYSSLVNYDKRFIVPPKIIKILRIKKISNNTSHKIIFAEKIINEYIKNKSSKKSFSLSNKRFIAPHQYLMAKKYFDKHNK
jgi:citrate lyase beta subunit